MNATGIERAAKPLRTPVRNETLKSPTAVFRRVAQKRRKKVRAFTLKQRFPVNFKVFFPIKIM